MHVINNDHVVLFRPSSAANGIVSPTTVVVSISLSQSIHDPLSYNPRKAITADRCSGAIDFPLSKKTFIWKKVKEKDNTQLVVYQSSA